MKQFYTYVHCRPDGSPFYVGKGHGKRAFNFSGEGNKHYDHVIAKYGVKNIVVEVMPCKSETEAFLREQLIIKSLRVSGSHLCNLTDGGQGPCGRKHSDSTKQKLRESSKRQFDNPDARKKAAEYTKAMWDNPVIRENLLEKRKDVDICSALSLQMEKRWADPKYRAYKSSQIRDLWKDSSHRTAMSAHARDQMIAQWKDPLYRENYASKMKAIWADPVYREKQRKARILRKERLCKQ